MAADVGWPLPRGAWDRLMRPPTNWTMLEQAERRGFTDEFQIFFVSHLQQEQAQSQESF
jgi:hypothetical protein